MQLTSSFFFPSAEVVSFPEAVVALAASGGGATCWQNYKTDFAVTQLMARFWYIVWRAKWVQNSTYLDLVYRQH